MCHPPDAFKAKETHVKDSMYVLSITMENMTCQIKQCDKYVRNTSSIFALCPLH